MNQHLDTTKLIQSMTHRDINSFKCTDIFLSPLADFAWLNNKRTNMHIFSFCSVPQSPGVLLPPDEAEGSSNIMMLLLALSLVVFIKPNVEPI